MCTIVCGRYVCVNNESECVKSEIYHVKDSNLCTITATLFAVMNAKGYNIICT